MHQYIEGPVRSRLECNGTLPGERRDMPDSLLYYDISMQDELSGGRITSHGTLLGEYKGIPGSILFYDISIREELSEVGQRVTALFQEITKAWQTGYFTIISAYEKSCWKQDKESRYSPRGAQRRGKYSTLL